MATIVRFSLQRYLTCKEAPCSRGAQAAQAAEQFSQPGMTGNHYHLPLNLHVEPSQAVRMGSNEMQPLLLKTFQDLQAPGQLLAITERESYLQVGLRLGSVPVVCSESNM